MRYLTALLCPPLAILLCGRPFLAVFSILLLIGYFPSALLAVLVVSSFLADRRHGDLLAATRQQTRVLTGAMMAQSEVAVAIAARQAPRPIAAATAAIAGPSPSAPLPAPKRPMGETIRDGFAAIGPAISTARASAIRAYNELPEWAQPITWGLSAGSVASVAIILFMMVRR